MQNASGWSACCVTNVASSQVVVLVYRAFRRFKMRFQFQASVQGGPWTRTRSCSRKAQGTHIAVGVHSSSLEARAAAGQFTTADTDNTWSRSWGQVQLENKDLHEYSQLLEEELEASKQTISEHAAALAETQQLLEQERMSYLKSMANIKQRLMAAEQRAEESERTVLRMRQAASVVDSGITEMQSKYDDILARMADEILSSQAEVQRLQAAPNESERAHAAHGTYACSSSSSSSSSVSAVDESSGHVRVRSCLLSGLAVWLMRESIIAAAWFDEPASVRQRRLKDAFVAMLPPAGAVSADTRCP